MKMHSYNTKKPKSFVFSTIVFEGHCRGILYFADPWGMERHKGLQVFPEDLASFQMNHPEVSGTVIDTGILGIPGIIDNSVFF